MDHFTLEPEKNFDLLLGSEILLFFYLDACGP